MNKMVLLPIDRYERLIKSKQPSSETGAPCPQFERLGHDIILTFVSPRFKSRAQTLINLLSEFMDWNDKGEIMQGDKCVPGSHIADLLRACLHNYKDYHRFEGMEIFCDIMSRSNIPLTVLGNMELRHKIEKMKHDKPKDRKWVSL